MLDVCPICKAPLINGKDSKQYIKLSDEQINAIEALLTKMTDEEFARVFNKAMVGEITVLEFKQEVEQVYANVSISKLLDAINASLTVYYTRTRLCPNTGNNDFTVPARYKGIDPDEAIAQALQRGDTVPINPPCPNYHGGDTGNPMKVIETIEIIDN